MLPVALLISKSMYSSAFSSLRCNWNRCLSSAAVAAPPEKQAILLLFPFCIISTNRTRSLECFRRTRKPCFMRSRNSRNLGSFTPPRMATYSQVSLKGLASNPMPPGEFDEDSIKPKSISRSQSKNL